MIHDFDTDEEADNDTDVYDVNEIVHHGVLFLPEIYVHCLCRIDQVNDDKMIAGYTFNKHYLDMKILEDKPEPAFLRSGMRC